MLSMIQYSIRKQTTSFMKEPNKKPTKEPIAALKDFFESWPPIISPIKAPTNGPMITPNGPSQKAAIKPSVQPQTPYFVPPNFLVPQIGMR